MIWFNIETSNKTIESVSFDCTVIRETLQSLSKNEDLRHSLVIQLLENWKKDYDEFNQRIQDFSLKVSEHMKTTEDNENSLRSYMDESNMQIKKRFLFLYIGVGISIAMNAVMMILFILK